MEEEVEVVVVMAIMGSGVLKLHGGRGADCGGDKEKVIGI